MDTYKVIEIVTVSATEENTHFIPASSQKEAVQIVRDNFLALDPAESNLTELNYVEDGYQGFGADIQAAVKDAELSI